KRNIPALVARSKSGKPHIFLFATERVPSALMRAALRGVARELGLGDEEAPGKLEFFPEQEIIKAGKQGTCVWMPYPGGSKTACPGVKLTGASMALNEFIHAAEALRQTPEQLALLAQLTCEEKNATSSDADSAY